MTQLSGKYAVVTGGAQGIGAAIVRRFFQKNAAGVVILDVNIEEAVKTAEAIDKSGERVTAIKCNVGSKLEVEEAFKKIYKRFGRIDILVNNAGITRDAIFHKMTYEQWDEVLKVNLNGVFYCCKQVVDKMREQKYGKIVNISSVSVYGNPGQVNYSASKAGIIGFSKTLAKELGRKNCTVNVVVPGGIETDMFAEIPEKLREEELKKIPMQRFGSSEEAAAVVEYLCSDDSSFVTGAVINCCGGAY